MCWKKMPAWLKGGVIGFGIAAVLLILWAIFALNVIDLAISCDGTEGALIGSFCFLLGAGSLVFLMVFVGLLAGSPLITIMGIVMTLVFYFVIGAVIGWIVGLIISRKKKGGKRR